MASRRKPLWHQIHTALQQRLSSGSLLPGMQLPSEQALAREWHTSRQTVRSALLALARSGRLRRRVGRGWFVADRRPVARRGLIVLLGMDSPAAQNVGGLLQPVHDLFADHDLELVEWRTPLGIGSAPSSALAETLCADARLRAVMLFQVGPVDAGFLAVLAQAGKPVVVIGHAQGLACDSVACDFAGASARLVRAAHAGGRRRIAFFGRHLHDEIQAFRARVDGYVATMYELGLQPLVAIAPAGIYQPEELLAWYVERFLAAPAEACLLDVSHTAALIARLHALRPIPHELVVAGYGNDALPPGLSLPMRALDAVFEPWGDLYLCAARRLLARLDGDTSRPTVSLVACDLVAGDSGVLAG